MSTHTQTDRVVASGDASGILNATLNERFAVAFVGWKKVELVRGDKARRIVARFQHAEIHLPGCQPSTPAVFLFDNGRYGGDLWSDFAGSLDAVMPFLDKWHSENPLRRVVEINKAGNCRADWYIDLTDDSNEDEDTLRVSAFAPTLARAVVLAMLLRHQSQ